MVSFVWFSHPPDYPRLAASVARVREIEPHGRVHIVLTRDDPAPPVVATSILRLDFDRGAHLNGMPATRGVATALAALADSYLVVKLDSDMLVSAPWWSDGPLVFQRRNCSYVGAYALPGPLLSAVAHTLGEVREGVGHEAIDICTRARLIACALGRPVRCRRIAGSLPEEITCMPRPADL